MSVCNYSKGSPLLNFHFFRNLKINIDAQKIDMMISFDVFEGISDQYFVEKNQTNFFAKKCCHKFS